MVCRLLKWLHVFSLAIALDVSWPRGYTICIERGCNIRRFYTDQFLTSERNRVSLGTIPRAYCSGD